MTLQAIQQGLWYPEHGIKLECGGFGPVTFSMTIDATGEKVAFVGSLNIVGKATGKTFSSAGAKIHFLSGAVTFATATSTIRVGIQGFSTTLGPPKQPDGTWSTYKDMVQGTDTFTASGWNSITMANGTNTLSHGDKIAVVLDFTTRAGADSLIVNAPVSSVGLHSSGGIYSSGGAWFMGSNYAISNCVIEFDDGTFGIIDGGVPYKTGNKLSYNDASNPDENGLIFQVPFACKVDALAVDWYGAAAAAADATYALYSTPLGTPTSMVSGSLYGERDHGSTAYASTFFDTFAAQTLSPNTDYCIALKATSTGNIQPSYFDIHDANYRKLLTGGTSIRLGYRNNSTGAFSETTTRIPIIQLRVCALDDGLGGSRSNFQIGI